LFHCDTLCSTSLAASHPFPLPLHDALPILRKWKPQQPHDVHRRRSTVHRGADRMGWLDRGVPSRTARGGRRRRTLRLRSTREVRSEEHTSELQSRFDLVCRLLLEKKNKSTE